MTTPNMRQAEADQSIEASGVWVAETKLKAGSLRLSGAIMQNITHIAPAIAAFFFTPFVVSLAGAHSSSGVCRRGRSRLRPGRLPYSAG